MKNAFLLKVFIAIVLAVICGIAAGPTGELFGVTYVKIFGLIGQLFLNALTLVVVPLVSSSIILGAARMGADRSFGSLGMKTLRYFLLTALLAIGVGLAIGIVLKPGLVQNMSSAVDSARLADIAKQSQGGLFQSVEQILLKIVPSNIIAAASQGQMVALILFCMLFGFFASRMDAPISTTVIQFFKGCFQVMMQITHLVMRLLPLGVFGLVAKAIATTGVETIGAVAFFFGTVLLGLFLYSGVILPLLLKGVGKVSPWLHIKAMLPALVTAFSTSSSAATLPLTLECVEKRAGVSNRVSSFVLPLGTSVPTGSALYTCLAVLFIAQAYAVPLVFHHYFIIFLMTLLTSLGTAGIPSASLISVMVILQMIGVPAEGMGLIMAVERLLDMFRTPVNVFGTSCCAVLAAVGEGETGILKGVPQGTTPARP